MAAESYVGDQSVGSLAEHAASMSSLLATDAAARQRRRQRNDVARARLDAHSWMAKHQPKPRAPALAAAAARLKVGRVVG